MTQRILVVDDEPVVSDLLAYDLRKAHYDDLVVARGEEINCVIGLELAHKKLDGGRLRSLWLAGRFARWGDFGEVAGVEFREKQNQVTVTSEVTVTCIGKNHALRSKKFTYMAARDVLPYL